MSHPNVQSPSSPFNARTLKALLRSLLADKIDWKIKGTIKELAPYWTDEEIAAYMGSHGDELHGVGTYPDGTITVGPIADLGFEREDLPLSSLKYERPYKEYIDDFLSYAWHIITQRFQREELDICRAEWRTVDEVLANPGYRRELRCLSQLECPRDTKAIARPRIVAAACARLAARDSHRVAFGVAEAARTGTPNRILDYQTSARIQRYENKALAAYRILLPLMSRYRKGMRRYTLTVNFDVDAACLATRRSDEGGCFIHQARTALGIRSIPPLDEVIHNVIIPPDWLSRVHAQGLADVAGDVCLDVLPREPIYGIPTWHAWLIKQKQDFSLSLERHAIARLAGGFLKEPEDFCGEDWGMLGITIDKVLRKARLYDKMQNKVKYKSSPV